MNNFVFGKNMENVMKHRDIKLVTADRRRNQLVSEPNYYTTKYFSENLLAIEMKKMKVKMNKPVYLGLFMNFGMIILNKSIKIMQNYVIWIQTVLSLILKQTISMKILLMMLKKDLIYQTMKSMTVT